MYNVWCSMYNVQCIIYIPCNRCIMYNVQYTVYGIHYTVQNTVYSVQCTEMRVTNHITSTYHILYIVRSILFVTDIERYT